MKNKIIGILICFIILISTFPIIKSNSNVFQLIEDKLSSEENSIKIYDEFDENITYYMNQGHIPSISALIIKNNSVVWKKGYGYSNIYKKINATENTIYLGASISKTITSTALMQLWEKDLFELDDDVNDYLPFPLRNPNYPDKNITFRMLLSHHSSLAKGEYRHFILINILSLSKEKYNEYLDPKGKFYNSNLWLNVKPSEKLEYSNIGYLILEYLVEILSNQKFDEYCTKNIFQPLKMFNTSFHVKDYNKNILARTYIWFKNI